MVKVISRSLAYEHHLNSTLWYELAHAHTPLYQYI